MKITFVMGIACGGKSTYIKNNFSDRKVIDLYDFQKNRFTVEQIWDSYMECKDSLIEAIKNNEDVVLEHTLLRAERRKIYIDAVKEVTDCPIDIVLINPDIKTIQERKALRNCNSSETRIREELEVLEIPTVEEGFDSVTIVEI